MASPDYIVHNRNDHVGVVVREGVGPDQELNGWDMDSDSTVGLRSRAAIPLGHKVALRDIESGETVLKYGHDIGRATQAIRAGDHVHTHNLATKRW